MRIEGRSIGRCSKIAATIVVALLLGGAGVSLAKSARPAGKQGRSSHQSASSRKRAQARARAHKLAKALKACKQKKPHAKRVVCERKARARLRAPGKTKRSGGRPGTVKPKKGAPESPGRNGGGTPNEGAPESPGGGQEPPPGTPEPPPRTRIEEEVGFTSVTLACPTSVPVGEPFSISGTAAPKSSVVITYTTPVSQGRGSAKADASGRWGATITPAEAGPYGIVAADEGVTSPECLTTAE